MVVVADFCPALMVTLVSVSFIIGACPAGKAGVASNTVLSSLDLSVAIIPEFKLIMQQHQILC